MMSILSSGLGYVSYTYSYRLPENLGMSSSGVRAIQVKFLLFGFSIIGGTELAGFLCTNLPTLNGPHKRTIHHRGGT